MAREAKNKRDLQFMTIPNVYFHHLRYHAAAVDW
jgi:hypothetical protein